MVALDGSILLAGHTYGSFASINNDGYPDAVVVMLQSTDPTPVPATQGPRQQHVVRALVPSVVAVLVLLVLCILLWKRGVIAPCFRKEGDMRDGLSANPKPPSKPAAQEQEIYRRSSFASGENDRAAPCSGVAPIATPTVTFEEVTRARRGDIALQRRTGAGAAAGRSEFEAADPVPAYEDYGESGRNASGDAALEEEEYVLAETDVYLTPPSYDVRTDTLRTRTRATGPDWGSTASEVKTSPPNTSVSRSASGFFDSHPAVMSRSNDVDPSSLIHERRRPSASRAKEAIEVMKAVLQLAEEVVRNSSIPIVSDAATLVSELARLLAAHAGNLQDAERKEKWCWSLLVLIRRAGKVLGQVRHMM